MSDAILFYIHYGLTLFWGVVLSAAFCGVRFTKRNLSIIGLLFIVCGSSQLIALSLLGEQRVWELYPLIVHTLLGVSLCLCFRKRVVTVIASISLAYLCCQPAKWFGLLSSTLWDYATLNLWVRIAVGVLTAVCSLCFFANYIAEIFNKDTRSVLIFSSVPVIYYLFDYSVSIYTDLWAEHYRLLAEFLAFFLCVVFMIFCIVYYREYERKMQTKRKNQIIEITVSQQAREIEAIRKSNLETSILRHDLRHLLNNLAVSIEQNDKQKALSLISGYVDQVDSASLHRYCTNDTVNYILTSFSAKCQKSNVAFSADLELDGLPVDEVMFSSILSNGLENALNAQLALPKEKRQIKLMLKQSDGRLLLSVKNPFAGPPPHIDYVNHLPVTEKKGHGYGTQSILYLTEKLGGKCLFSVQDNMFILRVVL